jgi:hypothetical protein
MSDEVNGQLEFVRNQDASTDYVNIPRTSIRRISTTGNYPNSFFEEACLNGCASFLFQFIGKNSQISSFSPLSQCIFVSIRRIARLD